MYIVICGIVASGLHCRCVKSAFYFYCGSDDNGWQMASHFGMSIYFWNAVILLGFEKARAGYFFVLQNATILLVVKGN